MAPDKYPQFTATIASNYWYYWVTVLGGEMASCEFMLLLFTLGWTTLAVHVQYYEAKIVITNASRLISGAYATIGTSCDMVNCGVKSRRNNNLLLNLISAYYLIVCNRRGLSGETISGSADYQYSPTSSAGHINGIIIPAKDVKQKVKRLARAAASIEQEDDISFPVIILSNKDIFLLSISRAMFNVSLGDEQFITYSVRELDHDIDNEQSDDDDDNDDDAADDITNKGPLYYIIFSILMLMILLFILIILLATICCVIWMCRKCTIQRYMESYVKTAVNQEQEDDGTNHCCICLENYKTNDVMAVLPCEHEYHKLCITQWLIAHRTCPLCKSDILIDKKSVVTDHEMAASPVELDFEST